MGSGQAKDPANVANRHSVQGSTDVSVRANRKRGTKKRTSIDRHTLEAYKIQQYCIEETACMLIQHYHRFAQFTSDKRNAHILYELDYFNYRLGQISVADLIREGTALGLEPYREANCNPLTLSRLTTFAAISAWLAHSMDSSPTNSQCQSVDPRPRPLPSNIAGVTKFFDMMNDIYPYHLLRGILETKLQFLYDPEKLLNVATNVLFETSNASYITLLCSAEGFLDLWIMLKLLQLFEIKWNSMGISWQDICKVTVFSIISIVMRAHPGRSLSTFKFAFDLTLERMEFLNANPSEFEIGEIIGCGSEGVVRKMRYRGHTYAIKTIHCQLPSGRLPSNTSAASPYDGLKYLELLDQLKLDYQEHQRQQQLGTSSLSTSSTSDPTVRTRFWRWLRNNLREFLSMLLLPRPEYVKLYYCYVGSVPAAPRFVCKPTCRGSFELTQDPEPGQVCPRCGHEYGQSTFHAESLHLVLEYCPGGSLREFLNTHTRLPAMANAIGFMCQMMSALAYHHARGVVHKDLKPENLLLRDESTLCLSDFGVSSFKEQILLAGGRSATTTASGTSAGDIQSAGFTALEFLGIRRDAYLQRPAVLQETIAKFYPDCTPEVAAALVELIDFMLKPNPAQRPNALSVLIVLERLRKLLITRTRGSPPPIPQPTNPAAAAGIPWQHSGTDFSAHSDTEGDMSTSTPTSPSSSMSSFSSMSSSWHVIPRHTSNAAMSTSGQLSSPVSVVSPSSTSEVHHGVVCGMCGMCPIVGVRFRCVDCPAKPSFDLCYRCRHDDRAAAALAQRGHPTTHRFEALRRPLTADQEALLEATDIADVMEHYGLLDDSDRIVLLGNHTGFAFRDFHGGVIRLSELYCALLTPSAATGIALRTSERVVRMALQHLARIVAKEPFRSAVVHRTRLIASLEETLFDRVSDDVKCALVDLLYIVTDITPRGCNKPAVRAILNAHLLEALMHYFTNARSSLLQSGIAVVLERCLVTGVPYQYFRDHLLEPLWDIVLGSAALSDRVRMTEVMFTAIRSYHENDTDIMEGRVISFYNLHQVAMAIAEKMKKFTYTSKGRATEVAAALKEWEASSVAECSAVHESQEIFRAFVNSLANAVLPFDALRKLVQRLCTTTRKILEYFCGGNFGIPCSSCNAPLVGILYHCTACGDVNVCDMCFLTHASVEISTHDPKLHEQYTYKVVKHINRRVVNTIRALHYVPMASPQLPNSEIGLAPTSSAILTLSAEFLSDRPRILDCPQCHEFRAIYVDGCQLSVCLSCDHRFCSACRQPWALQHTRSQTTMSTEAPAAYSNTSATIASITRLRLDSSQLALFEKVANIIHAARAQDSSAEKAPFSLNGELVASNPEVATHTACRHPLFSINDAMVKAHICMLCYRPLDGVAEDESDVTTPTCKHLACKRCIKVAYHRSIARGEIVLPSNTESRNVSAQRTFPALRCPVYGCNALCGQTHSHEIRSRVMPEFYEMFKGVCEVLLAANGTSSLQEDMQVSECSLSSSISAEHRSRPAMLEYSRCDRCMCYSVHAEGVTAGMKCFRCSANASFRRHRKRAMAEGVAPTVLVREPIQLRKAGMVLMNNKGVFHKMRPYHYEVDFGVLRYKPVGDKNEYSGGLELSNVSVESTDPTTFTIIATPLTEEEIAGGKVELLGQRKKTRRSQHFEPVAGIGDGRATVIVRVQTPTDKDAWVEVIMNWREILSVQSNPTPTQ